MTLNLFSVTKVLFFIALTGIIGCASGYAPVSDLNANGAKHSANRYSSTRVVSKLPQRYQVQAGDTLYSIAWRYGLDFKQLARKNHIASDYTIYRGQVLLIGATNKHNNKVNTKENKSANGDRKIVKKIDQRVSNSNKNNKIKRQTAQNSPTTKNAKSATSASSKVRWQWPVSSVGFSKFSNENKGLDFKGTKGQRVSAAAKGTVVYAGNGIIGYGNLIIIKHTDEYLSAYAHNSVILVEDNDVVKAGQKIAEIGNSGTTKTILHFEIRKDGKPVDPLRFLPKH